MWIKGEKFQLVLRKTIQRNSYDLFAKETHICWPFSIAVVQVAQVFKWHSLLTYTQFSAWLSAQWAKRNRKSQFWKDNALFATKAKWTFFKEKNWEKIELSFWGNCATIQGAFGRVLDMQKLTFFHDLAHCA